MEDVVITRGLPVEVVNHDGEDQGQRSATIASLISRALTLVSTKKA